MTATPRLGALLRVTMTELRLDEWRWQINTYATKSHASGECDVELTRSDVTNPSAFPDGDEKQREMECYIFWHINLATAHYPLPDTTISARNRTQTDLTVIFWGFVHPIFFV